MVIKDHVECLDEIILDFAELSLNCFIYNYLAKYSGFIVLRLHSALQSFSPQSEPSSFNHSIRILKSLKPVLETQRQTTMPLFALKSNLTWTASVESKLSFEQTEFFMWVCLTALNRNALGIEII